MPGLVTRSRQALLTSNLAVGAGASAIHQPSCGSNRIIMGGGYQVSTADGVAGLSVYESRPVTFVSGNQGWRVRLTNATPAALTLTVWLNCADVDD